MKLFIFTIVCTLIFSGCFSSNKQEQIALKNTSKTTHLVSKKDSQTEEKKDPSAQKEDSSKQTPQPKEAKALSPTLALLAKLGKDAKVEFAELDKEIISQDTLVRTRHGDYKISYTTNCLNDSLVALEMYNYEQGFSKSYRLQHNYRTNINMLHNGKPSGSRMIDKDIFKNKMEQAFLEKAIIKHPQFVRFDEEKNEAIFQFLVGVPATDWVVLAGVNLSPQGDIRIINVEMPPSQH